MVDSLPNRDRVCAIDIPGSGPVRKAVGSEEKRVLLPKRSRGLQHTYFAACEQVSGPRRHMFRPLMTAPVVERRDPRRRGSKARPRLCIVGPMIGRNPGRVTTQGEFLTDLLRADGYPVVSVSSAANRYVRFVDILATLVKARSAVDTILLQTYSGPSFRIAELVSALGSRFGQRIILHLHGGGLPRLFEADPVRADRVLRRADEIVAPTRFLAEAATRLGYEAIVIPNGIDLEQYRFRLRDRPEPQLLWMRSFQDLYNPWMALRVVERLRERVPEVRLVMAGQDKGLLKAMRAESDRLGLTDHIEFPGFLDPTAKQAYAAAADIYINTNRVDNAPVAVIEAGAWGLPVVSTEVGGVGQLLRHEDTGLLVADDDDAAMADGVCRLLEDPALAGRLSRNGRRQAEESAWPRLIPRWRAVLEPAV